MVLDGVLFIKPSPKSMTNVPENGMVILKRRFIKILLKRNHRVT